MIGLACGCTGGRVDAPARDWLIVPGERVGVVTGSTTEADLIRQFGDGIERRQAWLGEGFCAPGSVIHRGSSDSVVVIWSDSTYSAPAEARVTGPGSRWQTPAGVRIGTSLDELEEIGGGPVRFLGFGWDYGGSGTWTELIDGEPADVRFILSVDRSDHERVSGSPDYREILGERDVSSDHPLIQTMTIRVGQPLLRWREPTVWWDCT
jgi:hypothetical protein